MIYLAGYIPTIKHRDELQMNSIAVFYYVQSEDAKHCLLLIKT